jgi:hypothetical protein
MNKSSFAYPHLSVKNNYSLVPDFLPELLRYFINIREVKFHIHEANIDR